MSDCPREPRSERLRRFLLEMVMCGALRNHQTGCFSVESSSQRNDRFADRTLLTAALMNHRNIIITLSNGSGRVMNGLRSVDHGISPRPYRSTPPHGRCSPHDTTHGDKRRRFGEPHVRGGFKDTVAQEPRTSKLHELLRCN